MSDTHIIDLSLLPAPEVVKQYSYETILARLKADFVRACPQAAAALAYESDPLCKWFECIAYSMMLLRQEHNEDAQAVMLAYARGADLDQLGAIYQVKRLILTPVDETTTPPKPAVLEGDEALRKRIQLAPKSFSTSGPVDAYRFHSLSADARVLDAAITSPEPGKVVVTVLSREGDGSASTELQQVVANALGDDDVRPLTDWVVVQSVEVVPYQIEANVYTQSGPDPAPVMSLVREKVEAYASAQRGIGLSVPISGLYSALHQSGVQRVELTSPAIDVLIGPQQAAYCTGITLNQIEGGDD